MASTRSLRLWEKGVAAGIPLGRVNREGFWASPFSDKELADLKSGQAWITLTVGNWMTKPRNSHLRLDPVKLVLDPTAAKAVHISKPNFLHGRLLFDDGSPAILDPEPWPGGKIHLDFPFAGMVTPDSEGYFQVYFTRDQFEQLKEKRPRKNVYVPNFEKKGHSSALHAFPPAQLSATKKRAGVLKIPRPNAALKSRQK